MLDLISPKIYLNGSTFQDTSFSGDGDRGRDYGPEASRRATQRSYSIESDDDFSSAYDSEGNLKAKKRKEQPCIIM